MPTIERIPMGDHGLSLEPYYFGAAWGPRQETLARQAWEAVQRECQHIGCWRTKHPHDPPHTHHSVFVVGEERENVEDALLVVIRFRPQLEPPTDQRFKEALYLRRLRTAKEMADQGIDPGAAMHMRRNPKGWRMDHEGRYS